MKETEKTINVLVTEDGQSKNIKILVKKPNNQLLSQAQRIAAKAWTDCVRDGIMTKKELSKFMKENGVWDAAKDNDEEQLKNDLAALERKLYVNGNGGQLTMQEAKEIAIQMKLKRSELRDLISDKLSLEQNTAESLSDNARFDFLVAKCTYNAETKALIFKTLDDYSQRADSPIAYSAASALAQLLYSIDKDFELRLPENKFLKQHNLVNEDLMLVDDNNSLVDTDGRKIDKFGYYINEEGQRIDRDGNLLDDDGNYIPKVTIINTTQENAEPKSSKRGVKK